MLSSDPYSGGGDTMGETAADSARFLASALLKDHVHEVPQLDPLIPKSNN